MNSASARWKKQHGVTGRHVRARTAFQTAGLGEAAACVPPAAGWGGAERGEPAEAVSLNGPSPSQTETPECARMWLSGQHPKLI